MVYRLTKTNNMKQQTAVEWFAFQIMDSWNDIQNGKISIDELIEQAKQIEKEQHDNTWVDSRIEDRGKGFIGKEKTFEQYYNETYGGQGSPDTAISPNTQNK